MDSNYVDSGERPPDEWPSIDDMFKASAFGKFAVYFVLFLTSIRAYRKIYSTDTAPFLSR